MHAKWAAQVLNPMMDIQSNPSKQYKIIKIRLYFFSDPLRFKLNHFFLEDLSFPSEPPSSTGLSAFESSPITLLVLPLLK